MVFDIDHVIVKARFKADSRPFTFLICSRGSRVQEIVDRASESADDDHWIGPRPTALQITAFLIVGSVGLIIAGVQPVVLSALVSENRLTAAALGWTTTIEFVTIGAGVSLAGMLLKPDHIRWSVFAAAVLTLIADVAVRHQWGLLVFLDRAIAGLFEGGLVWATTLMIARSSTPARWAAVFLVTQGIAQLGFAASVPAVLMKIFGADGGFYALASTCAVAAAAAFVLPNRMQALGAAEAAQGKARIPPPALLSLVGVALIYAYFLGLFAYLTQLGAQAKLTEEQSGYAVALAVGVSILGSGAAAVVARRLSYLAAFLICLPANAVALLIFDRMPHLLVFFAASAVFGFFWGFLMPFQMPFVIESDPSRRASLLVPGIQSVGAAAGPLICSFFVTNSETRGALYVCAACLFGALIIAAALHAHRLLKMRSVVAGARA